LPPGSTEESRLRILFEQMQGNFEAVIDAGTQNRRELEEQIKQLRTESKSDFAVLTSAVRQNSEGIRKNSDEIDSLKEEVRRNSEDIRKNSEEIIKNREEIRRVTDRLEHMAEREQLTRLEHRVTALEQGVGISP